MTQFTVKIYLTDSVVATLSELLGVQNGRPEEENWAMSDNAALLADLLATDDVAEALEAALNEEMAFRLDLLGANKEETETA